MNKKAIFILTILAVLAVPMVAMAQAEFTLGGYVKMETSWDSTQMNKNMTTPVFRNNDRDFHHGRLKFTANSTRFNLTIKGPKLWGATTTGFIEVDFDGQGNTNFPNAGDTAIGGTAAFRMRHAMFRLNWPETELLLGQYWGYFSSFTPETAQDSGNQFTGSPTQRLPQIRLTQKFLGTYTASMLVGAPSLTNALDTLNATTNPNAGESSESPQVQAMLSYEADLYGKAAFYGRPRGFAAQISGGWQRTRFRSGTSATLSTWGQDHYSALFTGRQKDQQNLNHWIVQGSMFVPVIPTYSANLAGTASLSTQWAVGAGLGAFGEAVAADNSFLHLKGFTGGTVNTAVYDRELQKRYTGFIQGQYYFTNEWFLNTVWGMSKAFGVPSNKFMNAVTGPAGMSDFATAGGVNLATGANDMSKFWQQYSATLWYRPIQALKFGLQYSYARTEFFQRTAGNAGVGASTGAGNTSRITDVGEDHRVMFAGFFYF